MLDKNFGFMVIELNEIFAIPFNLKLLTVKPSFSPDRVVNEQKTLRIFQAPAIEENNTGRRKILR